MNNKQIILEGNIEYSSIVWIYTYLKCMYLYQNDVQFNNNNNQFINNKTKITILQLKRREQKKKMNCVNWKEKNNNNNNINSSKREKYCVFIFSTTLAHIFSMSPTAEKKLKLSLVLNGNFWLGTGVILYEKLNYWHFWCLGNTRPKNVKMNGLHHSHQIHDNKK